MNMQGLPMEGLRERSRLVKRISEDILDKQVIEEVTEPSIMLALEDYLVDNPIELIKAMYIVSNINTIVIDGHEGRELNTRDMKFPINVLNYDIVKSFSDIINIINETEEAEIPIVERIIDSGDLGFAKDIYVYDASYNDCWTYEDIISVSTIAKYPEFIKSFSVIFNNIGPNQIYNTVIEFLEDDLGLELQGKKEEV